MNLTRTIFTASTNGEHADPAHASLVPGAPGVTGQGIARHAIIIAGHAPTLDR